MGERAPRDANGRIAISVRDHTDVWDARDPSAVDDIYARDFRGHGFPFGVTVDRAQYKSLVETFQTAFPDCRIQLREIRADDEYVYTEWEFSGTHTDAVFGIPPSTQRITFSGAGRHRHRNGTVSEVWVDAEWRSLYRQLLEGYLQTLW